MSIPRIVVLSLLVSVSAWAVAAWQQPGARATTTMSMTLLPDLTPPKIASRGQAVLARLTRRLTPDMTANFDLFLYVSKSDRGPLAQRMYVFEKSGPEDLKLAYEWTASTGREKAEVNARGRRVLTATPIGYYQIDPKRMYPRYRSASWDQDMPNSMFLDWERAGMQTGLAIHAAAASDVAKLGRRASGGCVHLSPEHAASLYDLIRTSYRGPVPRFAYDSQTRTRSNRGDFMRGRDGALEMVDGYRVLIVLEDYGGEDAAML